MRTLTQTAVTCLLALCAAGGLSASASASNNLESMFQDDNQLIFNTPEGTVSTMDTLKQLGVDRIRVSVFWKTVAPDNEAPTKPDFDAANPSAYPATAWDRYDTIARLAQQRGIQVNFNVTSPAPNWATGTPQGRPDLDETFDPSAKEYGLFVRALGQRYSGGWRDAAGELIPRVRYWSIWNEPNQAGWLTPQWARDPRATNAWVETAPVVYRGLVDAAWTALNETTHARDTILIGETAPKGLKNNKGIARSIDALRFVRQMYCLDDNLQAYKGTSAQLRGCPVTRSVDEFPKQHPGLFQASGYAHHPYELIFSPHTKPTSKDWATIANIPDLAKLLRKIYQRYRQPIPQKAKNVPLYLTEFGYQTKPPDPTGVSLTKQAAYNNEAEYRAYADTNVRTLSQFLLVDDKPDPTAPKAAAFGTTFQTGLMTLEGKKKPGFDAYAMAFYLPKRTANADRRLKLWGIPRVAPTGARHDVAVEARGKGAGAYTKIATLKTDGRRGYVVGTVKVTRAGALRLAWTDAAGKTWRSRAIAYGLAKPAKKK